MNETEAAVAASFLQLRAQPGETRLQKLQRAMAVAVKSIWVDPESKKNLALVYKNGEFLQQDQIPDEPATSHLAEAKEEEDESLKAFEDLRGKAEEALQRMREEEIKKQQELFVKLRFLIRINQKGT